MTPPQRTRHCVRVRAGMVAAVVAVWMLAATGSAGAAIPNPLDGVAPDFGLFGSALDTAWKRVVAAVWAAVLIGITVRVIVSAYKVRRSKNRGYASDLTEGMEDLQDALVALGLAGLASPVVGAILLIVGG